jgi:hypothetical protein
MGRGPKVTKSQAFKALRKMDNRRSADAILIVRGRLDQEGNWDVDWEGAHWMPNLDGSMISPSGLPMGFGMEATKTLVSVTANDSAEEGLGKLGAAAARGFVDSLGSSVIANFMNTEEDKD